MEVIKEINGTEAVVKVKGRIDSNTSPDFQKEFMPVCTKCNTVTLDFGEVAYISSAGLRVLLLGVKELDAKEEKLTVINVLEEIKSIFEVTGFDEFMDVR